MTAQQYLSQLETLDLKLRQKEKEIYDLKLMSTQADRSGGKYSSGSRQENYANRYMDLEKDVERQRLNLAREKNKIISEIQRLSDKRYVQLLFLRYVPDPAAGRGRTLSEIADIMGYSHQYARELHAAALKAFAKKYAQKIL